MNCGRYRGVKLLEHEIKYFEKILEKRLRTIVTIDDIHFGLMPGKGTIVTIFVLRKMQDKYLARQQKLYMSFVDLK